MRSDIAKVVVERPRSGGRDRPIRAYRRSVEWKRSLEEGREDEAPVTESITFQHGVGKRLNDFLSPIRGFLRKSVGRPWDDVWSEASALLKPTSVMQRHVIEHLRDYVEVHTIRQPDGTVSDSRGRPLRAYFNRGAFYVDPDDGVLRQLQPKSRRSWRSSPPRWMTLAVDPDRPYLQDKNGSWFEVALRPLPVTSSGWIVRGNLISDEALLEARKADYLAYALAQRGIALGVAYDVWFKETAGARVRATGFAASAVLPHFEAVPLELRKHWKDGGILYCAGKRQLSKKDKKRLGLP